MRIIRLQAEGFMRLVAVDITPEGHLVEVRGKNEQGKSSLLGAIFAALAGADAAPIMPVRDGEEYAIIRTTLGDTEPKVIVTRYFDKDGTTSLKVENAEGATYGKAQTMLDGLVGAISFDPMAFSKMPPAEQATALRQLVKLDVDLDDLAAKDKADYAERQLVNRDAKQLRPRIEAIPDWKDLPEVAPDKAAIVAEFAAAADTNTAIDREIDRRSDEDDKAEAAIGWGRKLRQDAVAARQRAAEAIAQAEKLERDATESDEEAAGIRGDLAKLPPIADKVDTNAVRDRLTEADEVLSRIAQRDERKRLADEFEALRVKSEGLTKAMTDRQEAREKALAAAKMPVEGLGFKDFDGVLHVTLGGIPFSQASGAQKLKVSTLIAMAANPRLRILRVSDGSLLDEDNLKLLREIAKDKDFQIWGEFVGEGEGVGIIMEAGVVRGAAEPERVAPPKRRKKAEDGEGGEAEKDPLTVLSAEGVAEAGRQLDAALGPKADAAPPAKKKPPRRAFDEIQTTAPGQLPLGDGGK